MNTHIHNSNVCHEPLLSVIVPVYQTELFLKQSLDSILGQTYGNLEIIVVDDGSPDGSPALCDDYQAQYPDRIKVIHKENGGLSSARNVALDIAQGEYIAFVDSDDWLEQDAYQTMMGFLLQNDLDIVFAAANRVFEDGSRNVDFCFFQDKGLVPHEIVFDKILTDEIGGQVWLRVCHRRCWENVRFPLGRLYEDLAVSFLPLLYTSKPIGFLHSPLYNYRMNPRGISLSFNPKKIYDIFLGMRDHYLWARENKHVATDRLFVTAVRHALAVLNIHYIYIHKLPEDRIAFVETFLLQNRKTALQSKLTLKNKFLLLCYLSPRFLRNILVRFLRFAYRILKKHEK